MRRSLWGALLLPWLLLFCHSDSLASEQFYISLAGNPLAPAINDTITAQAALTAAQQATGAAMAWTAESTSVFYAGDFADVVVFVKGIPAGGDTSSIIRLALSAKCSPAVTDTFRAGIPDSLYGGYANNDITNGATEGQRPPSGSGVGLWPGEIEVVIHPWDGRDGKSNAFYGSLIHVIHLNQIPGLKFRAHLMQVRVRLLQYSPTASVKPGIQVWVMGLY